MTAANHSSVWATAQKPAGLQRRGRYLDDSTAHPGKMLPEIARRTIAAYTTPGQLVLDPMCGIGTTLVEAVHLDRQALGVELEPRWASIAAANLSHARGQGAPGRSLTVRGDARQLGHGLLDQYQAQVQLILSSPPYGSSLHGLIRKRPDRVEKYDNRYSHNPNNLAELPPRAGRSARPSFHDALHEVLAACRRMLAPNGYLALTARPYRQHGQLVDLPGQLEALAADAGLQLHDRLVALLSGVRDGQLVPRASFFQLRQQRSGTTPRMLLIAHEDLLIFTRQEPAQSAPKLNVRLAAGTQTGSGTR